MESKDTYMIEAMGKFGGSFVKALAAMLWQADPINYEKLRHTFPEYFEEYKKMANKILKDHDL